MGKTIQKTPEPHPVTQTESKRELSQKAVEFAQTLPSFTKGQLLHYAKSKGKLGQEDVDRVLGRDNLARNEYETLEGNPAPLGEAVFHALFQAYQPPVNRRIEDHGRTPYRIPLSTITDDPYIERVKRITGDTAGRERKNNVLDNAVRDCVIPILAIGEQLKADGHESPITLTFPEVYFREIQWFYPKVYQRLQAAHKEGAIDVGITNSHHSISPLADPFHVNPPVYTRQQLKGQWSDSVVFYKKHFLGEGEDTSHISVHIPEQATTPDLFTILRDVGSEQGVRVVTCVDSTYHNPDGTRLGALNQFMDPEGKPLVDAFYNNNGLQTSFTFGNVRGPDPLPDELRRKGTVEGLPTDKEGRWFDRETARIASGVVRTIFGENKRQDHYRGLIFDGKNSVLTFSSDAEWLGYHNPGLPVAFYHAMSMLDEFGVSVASTRRATALAQTHKERAEIPRASWSGGFDIWLNEGTRDLMGRVRGVIGELREPFQRMSDVASASGEEKLMKAASSASEHYRRSFISCVYWWSKNSPHYPDDVPVIEELYRNMSGAMRNTVKSQDIILGNATGYGVSGEQEARIREDREQVVSFYSSFLDDEHLRSTPKIRSLLDNEKGKWRRYLARSEGDGSGKLP